MCSSDLQIADPLSRQGKRLAVGISHNGIGVIFCEIGNLHAIVSQFPVGFIGNEINDASEFFLLLFQDCRQIFDGVLRINHAGRIVRRIYDHGSCIGGNLFLQLLKVGLEGGCIRRNFRCV